MGQDRRRTKQTERLRRSGSGEIQWPRARTNEQIGKAQQRRRFDQLQLAGIDDPHPAGRGREILRPRGVGRTADQKDRAGRIEAGEKFVPGGIRPILVGMRSANSDYNPGAGCSPRT